MTRLQKLLNSETLWLWVIIHLTQPQSNKSLLFSKTQEGCHSVSNGNAVFKLGQFTSFSELFTRRLIQVETLEIQRNWNINRSINCLWPSLEKVGKLVRRDTEDVRHRQCRVISTLCNRRFPSCLSPLFHSESQCEAFHMEIRFIHM